MSYCDCACSRELADLKREVDYLKSDFDSLKRDLQREVDDRQDAVRSVNSNLDDHVFSGAHTP